MRDAEVYGWRLGHKDTIDSNKEGCGISSHDWRGMVQAVQNYIKGLNFKYRTDLRSKGVSVTEYTGTESAFIADLSHSHRYCQSFMHAAYDARDVSSNGPGHPTFG